ncbi:uncharacterized protein BDR25DRAFT_317582 [Lindgomyces ingoldianus]|uniref:Uncharacterized protein n=1 Tax=Lindgomyces ingoldianus TaxID=673940 RepID=A0ACB6QKD4_9PLEO|nr:uncharacterized protein BDR25DRAFT_317582 [Lindgomyces ingoldianus]KAF2466582.1 hypothetical protein BDR25DRAFT_317582 [Lindgomyces ingoldianus]
MANPNPHPQHPSQQQQQHQPWTTSPPSASTQPSSPPTYPYTQAPQYPSAFQHPQQHQQQPHQQQRQTTPLPPAYPPAFQPQRHQTAFHHYQPPQRQNVVSGNHQITAPFQIPRMPHPWPVPGGQLIDPQLLAAGRGGEAVKGKDKGPAPPGQWQRPQGEWPTSRGS